MTGLFTVLNRGRRSDCLTAGSCHTLYCMNSTLEEITQSALNLPDRQRLVLAEVLLEATGHAADADADEAWEREIQARIRAVDSGVVKGVPWEQVLQELDK